MKPLTVAVLSSLLVLGCDPLGTKKEEQEESARQAAESRRQVEQRDSFARAMTEFANGRLKIVQDRMTALTRDLDEWRADVDKISAIIQRMRGEKTAQGKEPNLETSLLNLLRNPEVNALARKCLAADFTGVQGEYIERVREAREAEADYRKARTKSEENYDAMIKEAKKWVNATAEQREAEIARIRKEIGELEQRRAEQHKNFQELTRKTMVGNVALERERKERITVLERKRGEVDVEIAVKRRQVDLLRNPNAMRGMVSQAANRALSVQSYANTIRQNNLHDIDRYYKPAKTVTDVVAEWSAKTVGKLQNDLSEKVRKAEKELAELMARKTVIQESLLAIPVSDLSELKQIRAKLEK